MKLAYLFPILVVAACEKVADLPALQQETVGYAATYAPRFAELEERGKDLVERLCALSVGRARGGHGEPNACVEMRARISRKEPLVDLPGLSEATNQLTEVGNKNNLLKQISTNLAPQVDAAIKSNKPEQLRAIANGLAVRTVGGGEPQAPMVVETELRRVMDNASRRFEHGDTEVTAKLDAIEAWIVRAEATPVAVASPAAPEPTPEPTPEPAPAAGSGSATEFGVKLSTGVAITGAVDGIESQLTAAVKDQAAAANDKTTWFNFDRLSFQTGKTELDVEKSRGQLANIAEILKAFPTVKLKVGGYTDNSGSAETNQRLSQARAETVVKALVELGVAKDRLAAEGYGPEHPICAANDTVECKAKNRRIAVRVAAR